jgi:hypothetical protein
MVASTKGLGPEKDCAGKGWTRPLVREGAQRENRNCQTVINIWSWAPDGARHQDWLTDWLTDRPTVSRNVTLTSNGSRTAIVAGATNDRAWFAVLSLDRQRPCICCVYIHLITCNMQIVQTTHLLPLTVTLANDRPVLSSERAPNINNCVMVIKIWSYVPHGCFIPRQTGRLTVGRNVTLTLTGSRAQMSWVELSWAENSDQEIPVIQGIWERWLALENWVEEDFTVIWSDGFCVEIRCQEMTCGNW